MKYKISCGKKNGEVEAKRIDEALKIFYNKFKPEEFGAVTEIEVFHEDGESHIQYTYTEPALKKLGLYSKFEEKIKKVRLQKKTSNKEPGYD